MLFAVSFFRCLHGLFHCFAHSNPRFLYVIKAILELDFDDFSKCWNEVNSGLTENSHFITLNSTAKSSREVLDTNSHYSFRFLTDMSSINAVLSFLRLLGEGIGGNNCAIFVDECIADIYEECSHASESGIVFHGKGQLNWLRRRVGYVIMAKEVRRIFMVRTPILFLSHTI